MKNKILVSVGVLFLCLSYLEGSVATPESILPEGVDSSISINPYTGESGEARKGTIGATLNNVATLNNLFLQEETAETIEEIKQISVAIEKLIPSLNVIGVFDLFPPVYWIGSGEQSGRILAVILYFNRYPEKCTPELRKQLLAIAPNISSPYLKELLKAFEN